MRIRTLGSAMLCVLCSVVPATSFAQSDSTATALYALGSQSLYETGCFGPCACPVREAALSGTFQLTFSGFDGLYNRYAVTDVRWAVPESTTTVSVRGSGTYRVGGEVALQQELSLDLTIDGSSPIHFDSGLVSVTTQFPKIEIDIAAHDRMAACTDTVMHVQAAPDPSVSGASGLTTSTTQLKPAAPDPFRGGTELDLTLGSAGRADLSIYDVQGRVVRHLARGAWLSQGSHVIPWDGRRDNGAACPAGVYFVRARVDGRPLLRRVVKVQ
jgi:hypothetical protein